MTGEFYGALVKPLRKAQPHPDFLASPTEVEQPLARGSDLDVTLVNRDNCFLFTPMLHEVAASDLDITNIVSPIRSLNHSALASSQAI